MNHFPFLLAWRYLRNSKQEKSIATMAIISFLGIAIGTLCLTLVTTIMRGVEKATYQIIQGCHAPLTMQAHGNCLVFSAIEKVLNHEFPELNYSPGDIQYIMIQDTNNSIKN